MRRTSLALAALFLATACGSGANTEAVFPDLNDGDNQGGEDAAMEIVDSGDLTDSGGDLAGDLDPGDLLPDCDGCGDHCPGGFNCPCQDNGDCNSGWCVEGPEGLVCTDLCIEDCPDGWACLGIQGVGPDPVFICIPHFFNMCRPCAGEADCYGQMLPDPSETRCAPLDDEGSFCLPECSDGTCPMGYQCEDLDGTPRCLPKGGVCECTPSYVAEEAATPCTVENEFGACDGMRVCTDEGLAACDAAEPMAEACNLADDDCDGDVDEDLAGLICETTNDFGTCGGLSDCVGGETICDAPEPAGETCNGLDDDCDGDTDEDFPDMDENGIADCMDQDIDGDGVPNGPDNCPLTPNPDQLDTDLDGLGDICDPDDDNDGVADGDDCGPTNKLVFPGAPELCNGIDDDCDGDVDEKFTDTDMDGLANCVDPDDDGDGILDGDDNCPLAHNMDQADLDLDGLGDACDPDDDNDGDPDALDCAPEDPTIHHWAVELCDLIDNNCNGVVDEGFGNLDGDELPDCLDPDDDDDGIPDDVDNCPVTANPTQADVDGDGIGDACEEDADGDGDPNITDCAPLNPEIFHGADEKCDGLDNNCNQFTDEGWSDFDDDGDADCVDNDDDNDGVNDDEDCVDDDPTIYPGAVEACNGKDDNCDGAIDEGWPDADADGVADCVDDDDDDDGVIDSEDNCPFIPNPLQADADGDGPGDACDPDDDNDGVPDVEDCAPFDAGVFPGNPEVCNGVDDDCDGEVDEDFGDNDGDGLSDCVDSDDDNDGVPDAADNCPMVQNPLQINSDSDPMGDACDPDDDNDADPDETDCAPTDPGINHQAFEQCNGLDDDCDGEVDEGYADSDGDGQANCVDDDDDGDGVTDGADNCPLVANPGQEDQDGDGVGDVCENDTDGDGDPDMTDCKPTDPLIHHGATEECNGLDDNCNSLVDETFPDTDADGTADCMDDDDDGDGIPDGDDNCPLHYNPGQGDIDGDGLGDPCDGDQDGDGTPNAADCAPVNPAIHPGAEEICNGVDDNCDGDVDEADAIGCANYWLDMDGDTWGKDPFVLCLCAPTPQYSATQGGDCLDGDPDVHPGMPEWCDNKDNDCDQDTDPGCDDDGDDYCDADMVIVGLPLVCHLGGGDCDDEDAQIFPNNVETCDGVDNNCNNLVDEFVKSTFYEDGDGDGWGDLASTTQACEPPPGYVVLSGDCDDDDATTFPGAAEVCDGADNNCNGTYDEGYADQDGDGLKDCVDADDDNDGTPDVDDCAPLDPAIHPGVMETCDGIDNNCEGGADEVCGLATSGWPVFKFDLRRTGHSMQVQGPDAASQRWSVDTGAAVGGSPVVGPDHTVYVVTGGVLRALAPADGAELWSLNVGAAGGQAGATIRKDGALLVPGGSVLHLVSSEGAILATKDLGQQIVSNPTIDGQGRIYLVTGGAAWCLGPQLTQEWTFPVANTMGTPAHVALGLSGRVVFAATSHSVYALEPDGSLDWSYTHGGADTDSSVAIGEDGRIYQGFGSQVVSLSTAGGLIWTRSVGGDMDSHVSIFNTGFQCCNPVDHILANPNGNTGVWSFHHDGPTDWHTVLYAKDGSDNSTPVMDTNGDIYVGSNVGVFYSLTSGGSLRWSFNTVNSHVRSTAAIDDGVVYFGDDAGMLYAIENP